MSNGCHDTQHNYIQHNTQRNDIQHNNKFNATLSIIAMLLCLVSFVLSVVYAKCHKQSFYAECHYAKCHYAERHYAERYGTFIIFKNTLHE